LHIDFVNAVRVDNGKVLDPNSWRTAVLTTMTELNSGAKGLEGNILEIRASPELGRSSAIGGDL
jgi:hypothetical protein